MISVNTSQRGNRTQGMGGKKREYVGRKDIIIPIKKATACWPLAVSFPK